MCVGEGFGVYMNEPAGALLPFEHVHKKCRMKAGQWQSMFCKCIFTYVHTILLALFDRHPETVIFRIELYYDMNL